MLRFAAATVIVAACAPPVPTASGQDDDLPLPERAAPGVEERATTTSETKKAESSKAEPAADAGSNTGKLPFGAECTADEQCTGGICEELDDDVLTCTQACEEDEDCPDGHECNDDVCVVD